MADAHPPPPPAPASQPPTPAGGSFAVPASQSPASPAPALQSPSTQVVAEGPIGPVTQRLPDYQETYAKGFIDGMVNWVQENSPNPQYMPGQVGARTVAGLPTAAGVAGMPTAVGGSFYQGGVQQAGVYGAGSSPGPSTSYHLPQQASFGLPQPEPGSFVSNGYR